MVLKFLKKLWNKVFEPKTVLKTETYKEWQERYNLKDDELPYIPLDPVRAIRNSQELEERWKTDLNADIPTSCIRPKEWQTIERDLEDEWARSGVDDGPTLVQPAPEVDYLQPVDLTGRFQKLYPEFFEVLLKDFGANPTNKAFCICDGSTCEVDCGQSCLCYKTSDFQENLNLAVKSLCNSGLIFSTDSGVYSLTVKFIVDLSKYQLLRLYVKSNLN